VSSTSTTPHSSDGNGADGAHKTAAPSTAAAAEGVSDLGTQVTQAAPENTFSEELKRWEER
jgi:hypothetical protein